MVDTNPGNVTLEQLESSLHVWLRPMDGDPDSAKTPEREAILSDDERERWRRYRRPADAHLFLVAHALIRETLSLYAPVAPADWRFATNEYGRPEIVGGPGGLRFNLSHTPGMIALAVHDSDDAGVDVERIGRVDDLVSVAQISFSDSEQAAFMALPVAERAERFYSLWTLKEAYIKARGMGLAIPLKAFSFDLDDPERIGFAGRSDLGDDTNDWSFSTRSVAEGCILSTAQRLGGGPPRPVRLLRVATAS